MRRLSLVLILAIAVGSSGCASREYAKALVRAEAALYTTMKATTDYANATCDGIPESNLAGRAACRQFNIDIKPVLASAEGFSTAVATNSLIEIPAMLKSLILLRDKALGLIQDPLVRDLLIGRFDGAYGAIAVLLELR